MCNLGVQLKRPGCRLQHNGKQLRQVSDVKPRCGLLAAQTIHSE